MPKIQRNPTGKRIWGKISELLLDFAEKFPIVRRGFLKFLPSVRKEGGASRNAQPEGTSLDLHCIWLCEIIPIEIFEKYIPSIVRLFEEQKTSRFSLTARSSSDLVVQLRSMKGSVWGVSWYSMGTVDFEYRNDTPDIDYLTIEMESFYGDHVAIYICVTPREIFKSRVNRIVSSEFRDYVLLSPPRSWQSLFRGLWGWKKIFGESRKRQALQDLIEGLKKQTQATLNKYFSGLLFKPGYIVPSIELWLKEEVSVPDDENITSFMRFWESVGLRKGSPYAYTAESGTYEVHLPMSGDTSDLPIKILGDKKSVKKGSHSGSMESQIRNNVNDWVPTLLSLWSVRILYRDLIDEVSSSRFDIFSNLKKMGTRRAFLWTQTFFFREAGFRRLAKNFDLKRYRHEFASNIPDFKRNPSVGDCSSLKEDLIGSTSYSVEKLEDLLSSTQNLVRTMVEIKVVAANYKTQITNVVLSLAMIVLSILTLALGILTVTNKPKICELQKIKTVCEGVVKLLSEAGDGQQ